MPKTSWKSLMALFEPKRHLPHPGWQHVKMTSLPVFDLLHGIRGHLSRWFGLLMNIAHQTFLKWLAMVRSTLAVTADITFSNSIMDKLIDAFCDISKGNWIILNMPFVRVKWALDKLKTEEAVSIFWIKTRSWNTSHNWIGFNKHYHQ